jgi:hypothetical protein
MELPPPAADPILDLVGVSPERVTPATA